LSPAAEVADVPGVLEAAGLADETGLVAAVGEFELAESQWRRNAGDECTQLAGGQFPHLHRDAAAAAGDAHHARARGRPPGQRVQPVMGTARGALQQARAARRQLPVQCQALQVRTADHQAQAVVPGRL